MDTLPPIVPPTPYNEYTQLASIQLSGATRTVARHSDITGTTIFSTMRCLVLQKKFYKNNNTYTIKILFMIRAKT